MPTAAHMFLDLAGARNRLDDALDALTNWAVPHDGPANAKAVDDALCEAIAALDEVFAHWSTLLESRHTQVITLPQQR